MCHVPAVESEGSAGAPETEIEITPEMIQAGAEAFTEYDSRFEDVKTAAVRVYLAMRCLEDDGRHQIMD